MTNIVFDLMCSQPVGTMKFHGGGEYTKTVFERLIKAVSVNSNINLSVCYDYDRFIDEWIKELISSNNIKSFNVKSLMDIQDLIKTISKSGETRFFTGMGYSYRSGKITFPENVISIGVFHGFRVLEKPYDREAWRYGAFKTKIHEFLNWVIFKKNNLENERSNMKAALHNFDTVVTVSEHSKYSLMLNFPELIGKIKIKAYYSPQKYVPEKQKPLPKNGDYIMLVSADRWLKNSYRGIKAIDGLYDKGLLNGIKTRVYGNLPKTIIRGIHNKSRFSFYGYVSPEELEQAYSECKIFLYPSLNEGFGYPPLEAMNYGKTAVISCVCSLPEVYRDSVYFTNPYDIMEIQNRILQAVDNPVDTDVIQKSVARINNKQNSDLNGLIALIIGTGRE